MTKKQRITNRGSRGTSKNEFPVICSTSSCLFCLFTNLPTAILFEILFRLPIISIMNVKVVCKAFYKLICSHEFSLNYSKYSVPFVNLTLLTPSTYDNYGDTLKLLQSSSSDNEDDDPKTTIRTSIEVNIPAVSNFSLGGTCNGLVCLYAGHPRNPLITERVYICNPILGECMAVPEPQIVRRHRFTTTKYILGFCRSSNNNNCYKLLRTVMNHMPLFNNDMELEGEILTIGIDSKWRYLADTRFKFSHYSDPIALNGVYHWIVTPNNEHSMWITTLDLGAEKFGRLSIPHGLSLNRYLISLVLRDNQLCLFDCSNDDDQIAVWQMKQYGLAESWAKVTILDMSFVPAGLRYTSRPVPTIILQNGDLLFYSIRRDYIILCDPRKGKVKKIVLTLSGGVEYYAPSFLSLNEVFMGASLLKSRPKRKAAQRSRYGHGAY